jgi:hypothetical protein
VRPLAGPGIASCVEIPCDEDLGAAVGISRRGRPEKPASRRGVNVGGEPRRSPGRDVGFPHRPHEARVASAARPLYPRGIMCSSRLKPARNHGLTGVGDSERSRGP